MKKRSEKELDRALDEALSKNAEFAEWFVGKTKFAGQGAKYAWSRSNHPWGKVAVEVEVGATGERELVMREGETDVLVVFVTHDKRRVAIHIENKLSKGKFTPHQADLYAARAETWKGNPNYGSYEDWETILVAPRSFYHRNSLVAASFGKYIAHEEIASYIPAFG